MIELWWSNYKDLKITPKGTIVLRKSIQGTTDLGGCPSPSLRLRSHWRRYSWRLLGLKKKKVSRVQVSWAGAQQSGQVHRESLGHHCEHKPGLLGAHTGKAMGRGSQAQAELQSLRDCRCAAGAEHHQLSPHTCPTNRPCNRSKKIKKLKPEPERETCFLLPCPLLTRLISRAT